MNPETNNTTTLRVRYKNHNTSVFTILSNRFSSGGVFQNPFQKIRSRSSHSLRSNHHHEEAKKSKDKHSHIHLLNFCYFLNNHISTHPITISTFVWLQKKIERIVRNELLDDELDVCIFYFEFTLTSLHQIRNAYYIHVSSISSYSLTDSQAHSKQLCTLT